MGTRNVTLDERYAEEDHPHACGDKLFPVKSITRSTGSSPRVWGQAQYYFAVAHGHRIIPTRVGTRVSSFSDLHKIWDHPHACGDKLPFDRFKRKVQGSSPRVWGQVQMFLHRLLWLRIIPTRVGTSLNKLDDTHPR